MKDTMIFRAPMMARKKPFTILTLLSLCLAVFAVPPLASRRPSRRLSHQQVHLSGRRNG